MARCRLVKSHSILTIIFRFLYDKLFQISDFFEKTFLNIWNETFLAIFQYFLTGTKVLKKGDKLTEKKTEVSLR